MTEITPAYLAQSGTEDGEQTALFCYAVEAAKKNASWRLLYAIPNGGQRSAATAARLKAAGVKAGIPDMFLPVACQGAHGLYVEMKKQLKYRKNRKFPMNNHELMQEQVHYDLRSNGYSVAVAYGWQHAVSIITAYLDEC